MYTIYGTLRRFEACFLVIKRTKMVSTGSIQQDRYNQLKIWTPPAVYTMNGAFLSNTHAADTRTYTEQNT